MADPLAPLFTTQELSDRIGSAVLAKIFDDDDNGTADAGPLAQIAADAASKVRGKLGPVYPVAMLLEGPATELRRIALDIGHAMAAIRHPGFVKVDGIAMMKLAQADLEEVRLGVANLGTDDPPEPAKNQGGEVVDGTGADDNFRDPVFMNGMGDY